MKTIGFWSGWRGCCIVILFVPLIFIAGAVIAVTIGPYVFLTLFGLCCLFVIVRIVQVTAKLSAKYFQKRKQTKVFKARLKRQMQIRANMARIQAKLRGEI